MLNPALSHDADLMAEALRLAARVGRRPWPNPPVGAVVVRGGEVVGRGAHQGAGTPHAEVVALREAGERARGAALYCTLEPCNHHGRTPPCAPAVVASGVSRVVIGVRDPNPLVAGGGIRRLLQAGLDVTLGVCAEKALELIWPFVVTAAFQRPFVCLKTATSLDGRFAPATRPGRSPVYLTGERARREVHVLRRWCEVVLVGGETLRADAPCLDTRLVGPGDDCPSGDPVPAVATSRSEQGAWAGRRHIVFTARRGRDAMAPGEAVVAECEACEGGVDLHSIVGRLGELDACTLLVEGGPRLASAFLASGLVDRWIAYTAPVVLGSGPGWRDSIPTPIPAITDRSDRSVNAGIGVGTEFVLTRAARCGPDLKAVWDRMPFQATLDRLSRAPAELLAVEDGGH